MNAIDLIKLQHAELDRQIGELRSAGAAERADRLDRIADLLEAHAVMEEQVFYPCFKTGASIGALDRYADDHEAIRRLVAAMRELITDGDIAALATAFDHHAHREEERKLLPLVAAVLTDDELEALGDEMLARHYEVLGHHHVYVASHGAAPI